ncbi:MAG: ribonuclease E/G, partial [Desulfobacterales bacterium]
KGTQKKNIEETALMTNLEAAEEIARQLRLRDLGGLIVLDFIDMRESKHKLQVERTLKTQLKGDKARSKVGRISQFGLLEMTRQRIRPAIDFSNFETCPHCRGKGQIPSTESMGLSFLRQLNYKTLKQGYDRARGAVPPNVADYLLNKKRRELMDLERRRSVVITIEGDPTLAPGENRIILDK